MKGVRKGEILTFSMLHSARGTEVIYYIDVNQPHFRIDILKRDLRFPQLREELTIKPRRYNYACYYMEVQNLAVYFEGTC